MQQARKIGHRTKQKGGQHKIWEQKKLFEKNSEEVVSNGLAVDDAIYIATTKNLYKLNPSTGEVIWSQDRKTEKPVAAVTEKKSFFGNKAKVDLSGNATSSSAQFLAKLNSSIKRLPTRNLIPRRSSLKMGQNARNNLMLSGTMSATDK